MPDGVRGRIASLGAALALAAPADALAQTCAMCRSAVQSPDDPLARGINLSVALLVSAPFAVFASIAGWLAYAWRRARREAAAGAAGWSAETTTNAEDRT